MGMPTASRFKMAMASPRGDDTESRTRFKYMKQLASEIISEEPATEFRNEAMERGRILEPEVRDYYAMATNADLDPVGFIKNGRLGCSPDSLIGKRGMLEIKTIDPHLLIDILIRDMLPPEHRPQLQGNLMVAERDWIDLIIMAAIKTETGFAISYKMGYFLKRVYRDENYIARMRIALDTFIEDLDAMVKVLRERKQPIIKHAAGF